ncbi:MAG: DHH family phosphoesterase [Lachnospiraceae bacterium]|nr:DHH family phosphoesterase [Pseudobutyrivibrio sp.]MEE0105201.1 DHH family phosphoesterase [Lachnospiraceae bacterium]
METIKYTGKLQRYFQAPIYMIFLFVAGDVLVFLQNIKVGALFSICIVVYAAIVLWFYRSCSAKLEEEIIHFATHYGTVQKKLLNEFQLPYALMDYSGKILWVNEEFSRVTGRDKNYNKSITSIFKEITREEIEKAGNDNFEIALPFGDRKYIASMQRLQFNEEQDVDAMEIMTEADNFNSLIALLLFDQTELDYYKEENEKQKLVVALVHIDNYEEVFDSIEEVKRSLLTAIIDRKVNKYFQNMDAIVRKLDRDKFIVLFQQQYMQRLEEDKFSILEDIKTTKAGNELEITLSMGFGIGGNSYVQNAEFARVAIDLALGRGGSQAVIKNNSDVSYYGVRGKEIERNTRVKARVKAQALREIMETREEIIIMGHPIADVDSFGAAIGLFCAAREIRKNAKIVLNTVTSSLRPLVESFSEAAGYPEDMFITAEQAEEIADAQTLVIVVDTNRPSYTDCPRLLEISKSIVVFDHHRQGSEQVVNPILSYIEPYASSACEMIAEVLQYFSEKVHLHPNESDCIYAGILIDTNNFMTKTGVRTFEAAAYLRRCGAEVTRVRKLLREDMSAYKARAEVIRHAEVYRGLFAISICESGQLESPTVVGAKAANELLNIVGIKASFVLTEFQHKIYVSSRSIDEIDVQHIMERLGGGGHLNVAGAQIENSTVDEVKRKIEDILDMMIDEGEIKL